MGGAEKNFWRAGPGDNLRRGDLLTLCPRGGKDGLRTCLRGYMQD